MKRKVVKIDEELCIGCGLCINACQEGAIQLVDGKAKLVNENHCDGLGNCLPECPTGAIELVEREVEPEAQKVEPLACGCPGTLAREFTPKAKAKAQDVPSELGQWPVQLHLLNPGAPFFAGANLLVAADCTAFAYGNFHRDFIRDHIVAIGCPKLDDTQAYLEKLTTTFKLHDLASVTVVRMQVPCCSGMVQLVKLAMEAAEVEIPYRQVVIDARGNIIEEE